jgi:hypothetical protein
MASLEPDVRSTPGERATMREQAPAEAHDDASLAALINGLIEDAQRLVRKEIDLARQEVTIEIDKARQGATTLGIGAGLAIAGGILLAFMLVYLLVDLTGLSLWLSFLIIGAILTALGVVFVLQGVKRMKTVDPVPHETLESVKEDVTWITGQNPNDIHGR